MQTIEPDCNSINLFKSFYFKLIYLPNQLNHTILVPKDVRAFIAITLCDLWKYSLPSPSQLAVSSSADCVAAVFCWSWENFAISHVICENTLLLVATGRGFIALACYKLALQLHAHYSTLFPVAFATFREHAVFAFVSRSNRAQGLSQAALVTCSSLFLEADAERADSLEVFLNISGGTLEAWRLRDSEVWHC